MESTEDKDLIFFKAEWREKFMNMSGVEAGRILKNIFAYAYGEDVDLPPEFIPELISQKEFDEKGYPNV